MWERSAWSAVDDPAIGGTGGGGGAANQLALRPSQTLPPMVIDAGDRAGVRFLEFFGAKIRNPVGDETLELAADIGADQHQRQHRGTARDSEAGSRLV